VVILADTTTPPKGSHQPGLLEINPPPYPPPQSKSAVAYFDPSSSAEVG